MADYRSSRLSRRRARYSSSKIFLYSKLAKYAFFGLIGLIILATGLFLWYGRELPTPGKLIEAPASQSTRIYDKSGILLYSVYQTQNRTYVKLSDVPKILQEATIAIEDKNFYKNQGFSIIGYLRAMRNILLLRGLSGGSTITQQLVKNVLLSSERTIPRKIKELMLAIQVDKKYSKDEILEMYLNDVPYGGANIGVEAAAESYFGKKVKDLDLSESAFLAGLPQAPSTYSPFSGKKYYIGRTEEVLNQMVNEKIITKKQKEEALASIKNKSFSQKDTSIKAPHFVMYVKELLAQKFGESMVDGGGLQVTTTLDYSIQKDAEQIVKEEIDKLKGYNVGNGAAIVTDPKTGQILAMVGSLDYFDTKKDGNFNAALSNRQPGSSLKPIMYATAFEKGYTPSTMVMDTKTDFPSNDPKHPIYTPVNYDGKYHGPLQLRFALGNSINIPAVKMLARVGIKDVMQKAYDMGIKNWQPTRENMADVGLSLVLGGRETSLLSEVIAYGVFANQGARQDPVTILKVTDSKGNTLYEQKNHDGQKVLSPEISFLISHILLDNNARSMDFGPNSWLVIPGKTVSVKTGTTDEKRDNWTVGYTPSYVVGVWVGNNDNTPMNQAISSGVTGASPIWNRIMSRVLKGKTDESVSKPDGVLAMQVDSLGGGLPVSDHPTRSEYFIKGTEPTAPGSIYKKIKLSKHQQGKLANDEEVKAGDYDTKDYIVFHEDDPVSTDGKNRWQEGIDAWLKLTYSAADSQYYPPTQTSDYKESSGNPTSPTPTPSMTPTPSLTPMLTPTPTLP
ncbi:MAG: PBP1A family penicillin-binding protein [Patescibacteria group bacterium]|nr:PBP1A family penicillin-binding protein [Patescibacteria group bacterium]